MPRPEASLPRALAAAPGRASRRGAAGNATSPEPPRILEGRSTAVERTTQRRVRRSGGPRAPSLPRQTPTTAAPPAGRRFPPTGVPAAAGSPPADPDTTSDPEAG